jgi:flagellar motor protein MotB
MRGQFSPSALPRSRRALTVASPADDDDQTSWLVIFSDLVLQLFAFVLVAVMIGSLRQTLAERSQGDAAPPAAQSAHVGSAEPARVERPKESAERVAGSVVVAGAGGAAGASEGAHVSADAWLMPPAAEVLPAAADVEVPRPAALPMDQAADGVAARQDPDGAASSQVATVTRQDPESDGTSASQLATVGGYLEKLVEAEGLADDASVTVTDSEAVLSISDTIGFASGSAELRPGAAPILREVRTLARSMPNFGIDIAGHTDDVPIHNARFPSNLELSLARAARVARELTAGAPELRVRTVAAGFGEHRPLASNADSRGRARNRRVELRLVPIDHSTP